MANGETQGLLANNDHFPHLSLANSRNSISVNPLPDKVIRWKGVKWTEPVHLGTRILSHIPLLSRMVKANSNLRLNGVSGEVKTKEVVALMGPSGAGKTTLMKCLSLGNSFPGWAGGTIEVEGFDRGIATRMINQDVMGHLQEHLTVYETLMFSSEIRNRQLSLQDHNAIVEKLMKGVEIENLKNVQVGSCSGGERKRVAVALELTTNQGNSPNVVCFLDEVTSELDSGKAYEVMKFVVSEAEERDMAVICTIHQPDQELFELFSKVIVLSNQGGVFYDGKPTGIPGFLNEQYSDWAEKTVFSKFYLTILIDLASQPQQNLVGNDTANEERGQQQQKSKGLLTYNKISWMESCARFFPVVRRTARLRLWNDWLNTLLIVGAYIGGVVATCLLYGDRIGEDPGCEWIGEPEPNKSCISYCVKYQTMSDVQQEGKVMAEVKLIYFQLLYAALVAMLSVSLSFSKDFKVFLNEHRNNWYTTGVYFWSKFLVEGILQLVLSGVFALLFYLMTHQPDWNTWNKNFYERFVCFLLPVMITTVGTAMGLGFLVGVLFVDSFNATIIVSTVCLLTLSFFSGFFKRTLAMGLGERLVSYCSFLRFSLEITLIGIYGNGRCKSNLQEHEHDKAYALVMFNLHEEETEWRWAAFGTNMAVLWLLAVGCLFAKVKWFSRS